MDALKIDLENCYGIRRLAHELDISKGRRHVAIYASNGTMKSSLAKTFLDVSAGDTPRDLIFNRPSRCSIADENGPIPGDRILVIRSQADASDMPEASSGILASRDLRDRYGAITADLESRRTGLIKSLSALSGIKKEKVVETVLEDFGKHNRSAAVFSVLQEYADGDADPHDYLSGVRYGEVLNDRVLQVLQMPDVRRRLQLYVQKYNELVSKSPYLSAEFDHNSAEAIKGKLSTTGFFKARHSVNLNPKKGGGRMEIASAEEMEELIGVEKRRIDAEMDEDWQRIDKALSKNVQLQTFLGCVAGRSRVLELLLNGQPRLRRLLWLHYFAKVDQPLREMLGVHASIKGDLEDVVGRANEERTLWDDVVQEFKRRFSVPFGVDVVNRSQTLLEGETPALQFSFRDGDMTKIVTTDDLGEAMSTGEARAFYVLNVLFKINALIKEGKETVIVMDDIVDSFDYANKYAILQYLKEISEKKFFRMVILTHNFDFFRAVEEKGIVKYKNCYYASRSPDGAKLRKAANIKSPLGAARPGKKDPERDEKFVASIALARNIVEYARGTETKEYLTLTSLLHWRPDTKSILVRDLRRVFRDVAPQMTTGRRKGSAPVYDIISETAEKCMDPEKDSLYSKIALSVAIRIAAERFMWDRLHPYLPPPKRRRTGRLIDDCKKRGLLSAPEAETLDEVGIAVPDIIHLNAFMYEPIVDIDHARLQSLFSKVRGLRP